MALSLKKLGRKIWETLTPQNEDALRAGERSIAAANQRLRTQNNRYGALADPVRREQFIQQNQAPKFSLARATAQSARDTFTRPEVFDRAPRVNVGSFRGSGLIEDFVNSPYKIAKGGVQVGQGQFKQGVGNVVSGVIEGPLGLIPVGRAAQAGLKGAGLGTRVLQGARTGIKQGAPVSAAYGAANAMSQNADLPTIAKSAALGGAVGAAGGAVLGGGVPLAVAGAKGTAKAAVRVNQAANEQAARFGVNPEGGYVGKSKPKVTLKAPGARPSVGKPQVTPPAVTGKQRGFVTSVKESPEVSQDVQAKVSGTYEVRNTKALADRSQALTKNLKKSTTDVRARLEKPAGMVDDQTVSDSIAVAKAHDAKGDFQAASDIYDKLAEHLTKSGQTVQAASLLDNLTPDGLRFRGMRELKRAGVKVDKDLEGKIKTALNEVKKTKPGTPERTYAVQTYKKLISDNIPADLADKLTSFWKAGLLTGVRTQTGNVLSNTTFGVMHGISEPLAVALDKTIGLFTGKRTKALTLKGRASGVAEGAKKGAKYLKTGVDELSEVTNKFDQREIKFKNKALNVYVNGVFRAMGAADKPFRYAQLRHSLYDQALAAASNLGLKGGDKVRFVRKFVDDPPKQALQTATDEAAKAVLGNDTYLSKLAGRVRQAAESIENPAGRTVAKVATGVLMPFTKVPSAFISRVFDFTPVGAIKEAVIQISKRKLDQRTLATALSEATTGTAIIYLGAELANNDLLSGEYPNDPKEQARWKAEGIQPNSIKVGDTWLSLNYFGPVGALFSQGKRAVDTIAEGGGASDVAAGFTGGAVQDALGQSFLQGASGALDAVQDPKRYAQSYTKNQAGSVVPTLVKDVAEATDTKQRATNTAGEAIQARIPGVRQKLSPAQDVYGNDLERKTTSINTMVNPFRPSDSITNDVKDEVRRLHDVDPGNRDLQITPTPVDKTLSLDGTQTKLTDKQRYALQKDIGQATQGIWGQVIQTPEYQALSDVDKADLLNRVRLDMTTVVKNGYAAENEMGPYAPGYAGEVKEFTRRQAAIINDEFNIADYLSKSKTGARATSSAAKKTGVRRAASRSGKGSTGSAYKYAVSLNAGGQSVRPTVTARRVGRVKSKRAGAKVAAKPKVTLKKVTA